MYFNYVLLQKLQQGELGKKLHNCKTKLAKEMVSYIGLNPLLILFSSQMKEKTQDNSDIVVKAQFN